VNEPGVTFDAVWKKFHRGQYHDSLRDLIPATVRRLMGRARATEDDLAAQEFWALRDVSFRVRPGEALGIIGANGSGKSTTLKLLTKILRPTRGAAALHGRVGALIEIAAGFHQDLSGRDNVYLQGAIMGMKRAEIKARFDEIVEFAGVGDFIDTQVKRYSSGMNARLGFAIAAHLNPDVMIIDEVLSVGDVAFQDKCVHRMRQMIANGVPVVFVSHNLPAVAELCTRVIVLRRGVVTYDGDPVDAIHHHRSATMTTFGDDEEDTRSVFRIRGVEIVSAEDSPSMVRSHGELAVRIHYRATERIDHPSFGVDIHSADGAYCFGTNTTRSRLDGALGSVEGDGTITLRLPDLALLPGFYVMSVYVRGHGRADAFDERRKAYPFSVTGDAREAGMVAFESRWEVSDSLAALAPADHGWSEPR
jgi:ABC-type polysaccharide/polyol phosphate transport system ATPase subunit